ncbi:hypothetical protein CAPTEDRAFT_220171 [Capitella teleta]|uniref:Palmitoyltransferase n=1 Tax=Capitella teleta TaxID=283909 RepID=R7TC08_CAPTE|nr:hypothetical protein CAPTEDRAFT_220171 [Capitella teleta]|eukprot:ELT91032.1 hypothetical protein CAPTEDRAFT_220171 [Capitella teleta]
MAPTVVNICFALVRWTPVLFITAVIVWSYYAYVIQMCLFSISNIPEKIIYLFIYHPILFIFCWAYWKTIFTETGTVPKEVRLTRCVSYRTISQCFSFIYLGVNWSSLKMTKMKKVRKNFWRVLLVDYPFSVQPVRYCEKCKCIKPDRAHHCSVCGKCNLKMDHHCPWVNNCVCFTNYKFFVLFLGYGLLYCAWIASTSIQYFIKFWTGVSGSDRNLSNLHVVFLFFASIMFSISLLSLFGYHLFLVCSNRSTLETFRAPIFRGGPDKDGFSLGRKGNFIEVFGDSTAKWFLPLFTSFGDGVNYPVRTIDEDYDTLLGQRQRWMEDGTAEEDNSPGFDNSSLEQT